MLFMIQSPVSQSVSQSVRSSRSNTEGLGEIYERFLIYYNIFYSLTLSRSVRLNSKKQLLYSPTNNTHYTDLAWFAAVGGLILDDEFDCSDGVVLGCVRKVPVFAIILFSMHSLGCLILLISKLRSEYELIVFTTESSERRKYAMSKEFLSGYGFHFCVLFLLKSIIVLYALLPDTSYAVKSIPLYILLIFLTATWLSNILSSESTYSNRDPIYVTFTLIPGCIFLVLSLIELPMIVLKLDNHFDARWYVSLSLSLSPSLFNHTQTNTHRALIFIPYWIGLIVTTCGACVAWSLSAVDVSRHAYRAQSAEAETGMAFNRALLTLLIAISIISFLALVSEMEDDVASFSKFRTTSPIWGAWLAWLAVYVLDHVFDALYRLKNCYRDMIARKRQRQKECDEADAHRISSSTTTTTTTTTRSNQKKMKSIDEESDISQKHTDIESQTDSVLQVAADREMKIRIHDLELAQGELRILRHLTEILNIVQEYNVASAENRELLIKAARIVREAKEEDWTRDVAQMFGKLLREFTGMGTIIKTKSSSMRSIRALRERDVPEPPALNQPPLGM